MSKNSPLVLTTSMDVDNDIEKQLQSLPPKQKTKVFKKKKTQWRYSRWTDWEPRTPQQCKVRLYMRQYIWNTARARIATNKGDYHSDRNCIHYYCILCSGKFCEWNATQSRFCNDCLVHVNASCGHESCKKN